MVPPRPGVEYERYDFGGTDNGLPDQSASRFGSPGAGVPL